MEPAFGVERTAPHSSRVPSMASRVARPAIIDIQPLTASSVATDSGMVTMNDMANECPGTHAHGRRAAPSGVVHGTGGDHGDGDAAVIVAREPPPLGESACLRMGGIDAFIGGHLVRAFAVRSSRGAATLYKAIMMILYAGRYGSVKTDVSSHKRRPHTIRPAGASPGSLARASHQWAVDSR